MNHPLQMILRGQGEDVPDAHPLAPEAQVANLRAAWEHYCSPKPFAIGDMVQYRPGLSILRQTGVVLLLARWLSPANSFDEMLVADTVQRLKWNKVDCVVARQSDEGSVWFEVTDSDLLEPYEAA